MGGDHMVGLITSVERRSSAERRVIRSPCQHVDSPWPGLEHRLAGDRRIASWWLVHTKARQEKALAAHLDTLGIHYFLPLVEVRRRHGGRITEVQIPLFPGYLFLSGKGEERQAALRTNRVANVLEVADQQRLMTDLRQIHRLTSNGAAVDVYPGLRRGRRCRITGGSLKGLEGVILRRRGVCRVSIAVDVLGQSAEVEIDGSLLEVIE